MALRWNVPRNPSIPAARAEPPCRRPVSERKIQANRENALCSTGPRTERGKRTASRNAITHGFLAREVVIRTERGEEGLEEFQTLLGGLYESYEPVSVSLHALAGYQTVTVLHPGFRCRCCRMWQSPAWRRSDPLLQTRGSCPMYFRYQGQKDLLLRGIPLAPIM